MTSCFSFWGAPFSSVNSELYKIAATVPKIIKMTMSGANIDKTILRGAVGDLKTIFEKLDIKRRCDQPMSRSEYQAVEVVENVFPGLQRIND